MIKFCAGLGRLLVWRANVTIILAYRTRCNRTSTSPDSFPLPDASAPAPDRGGPSQRTPNTLSQPLARLALRFRDSRRWAPDRRHLREDRFEHANNHRFFHARQSPDHMSILNHHCCPQRPRNFMHHYEESVCRVQTATPILCTAVFFIQKEDGDKKILGVERIIL